MLQHKTLLSLSWLVTRQFRKLERFFFLPSLWAPLRGRVKRAEVVQWDYIKSRTSTMVSSVCSHVSFVHTFCNWIATLKWLSLVPCCSTFPSDLQRMSNVIAWPSSSRGMLMELFGSLPPEAGGMDLFHLMSVWGSGGEKRITGWHCFNWQEGSKTKDTMQCFLPLDREPSADYFGDCFSSIIFGGLRLSSRARPVKSIQLDQKDINSSI